MGRFGLLKATWSMLIWIIMDDFVVVCEHMNAFNAALACVVLGFTFA
jgi:hypothetical protein